MANGLLMVRGLGAIVMQILIISLIKALGGRVGGGMGLGAGREEGAELTLAELGVSPLPPVAP